MKPAQSKPAPMRAPTVWDWREQPSQIDWSGKTERQALLDATRVNRESTLGAVAPPVKR